MILKKLTIKRFGKIYDKTLEFSPGINVLYGENESGKSTLHTFIKSMFFGLTRQRGRAAKNDTYARYEPWDHPADYGGILWFESRGKNYRLTRTFYKENQGMELFSLEDGEVLDGGEAMEDILGEVSEAVYDNTVSVAQLKSVTGQDLARELQNYMASYQGTGDCFVDLGRAMQMLKMSRKGYRDQKEKRIRETEKEQEKLRAKMEYLGGEMEELERKQSAVSQKEEELYKRMGPDRDGSGADERLRSLQIKKAGLFAAMAAALFLGIASVFFRIGADYQTSKLGWDFSFVFALLGAGTFLAAIRRNQKELARLKKLRVRQSAQQEKLRWNKESLKETYGEKKTDYANLMEEYQEYEAESLLPSVEDVEIQALEIAMSAIEEISGNIHRQVGRRLRSRISRILREVTNGKYQEVVLDTDLHMMVNTKERAVPVERLSRGTMEQIYFALRMAAADLFCKKEPFPIILDDVFGMYDEERLTAMLHWLDKEKRQVIISTCSKREMELLDKEGIPYQKLEL